LFKTYADEDYKEMISLISHLTPSEFANIKDEEMSLMHHVAYDGNIEAFEYLKKVPYF
jgi:hypothetical protein